MVNKFGEGRVFVAGGELILTCAGLNELIFHQMRPMFTVLLVDR